jgi:outer membrane biosynthesis protein TonB
MSENQITMNIDPVPEQAPAPKQEQAPAPKQEQAPAPKQEQAPAPEPQFVNIPFVLLQNIKTVIETAGNRGVFKTAEMLSIGTVFNDVDTLIQAATKSV